MKLRSFKKEEPLKKTLARNFASAGARRKGGSWPAGVYRGEIKLVRAGDETYSIVREITIE